ncbi:bifunctional diaminohydroxyphosphoribosylaminopyrimidine deaminase/5-amino-6-(5-phosphoribosylamino)uracil reductase RibD [Hyphomonas sp.]|uniref:bifunctional diaminohydroxyphosphoribosylaminopyrimidine deaminase/5-amino-6-(5-phosphoribosylamino)uracil reductase RibD n=1 Tax=Hyphomonas sp. TaxID=87 RepID=UPI0025C3D0B2|nr:bifunctional diaminohydroxyphosphoribosylaminopyrimidine deaminase/5-amino-6-(5-phosphoribosylamino)uracil reductase RibD [Hyphomonas sp.]
MSKRRDQRLMGRALALAGLNQGLTGPNPSVGCVIVDAAGHIAGEGVTGKGGRPHAEEIALDESAGRARGGTAYVTLEPCRERSSGAASCASKLVSAGIARVVVAVEDPHPTARDGIRVLRESGIRVLIGPGGRNAAQRYAWFFAATPR